MILPAVALFRLAKFGPGGDVRRTVAGGLLVVLLASLVGLRTLDPVHHAIGVIWPVVLGYLLVEAHLEKVATRKAPETAIPNEAVA
jgi:hypothetical protein